MSRAGSFVRSFLSVSIAVFFAVLAGCSSEEHAGVISETESGKTVAGVVYTQTGTAASRTVVSLMDTNFVAGANYTAVTYKAVTDKDGRYEIKDIPAGVYSVLAEDSAAKYAALSRVTVEAGDSADEKEDEDAQDLPDLKLSRTAMVAVTLSAVNADESGNMLCFPGTFACRTVDAASLASGVAVIRSVPAATFRRFAVISSEESASMNEYMLRLWNVDWTVDSGKTLFASGEASIQRGSFRLTRTLPDTLQKYAGADSVPFPVWLPVDAGTPLVIDDSGKILPVHAELVSGDSALYWMIAPRVSFEASTTIAYTVFDSVGVSAALPAYPLTYALHFDSASALAGVWGNAYALSSATSPYAIPDVTLFGDTTASLSFWIKLDSSAFGSDSSAVLFSAMTNGSGFVIRQNAHNRYTSIGTELYVRTDSGIMLDTVVYGSAMILDKTWHQYALLISGDHISVLLDGKVIHDTDFKRGNGFSPVNPVLGGSPAVTGTVDELMFYNGTQDTTWFKVLYELQRPSQVPWTRTDSL